NKNHFVIFVFACPLWKHRHLRRFAVVHQPERFIELRQLEAVSYHGRGVYLAGSYKSLGLIPGLPDKAARYTVDGRALEHQVVGPVYLDWAGRDAQERCAATVAQGLEALLDSPPVA